MSHCKARDNSNKIIYIHHSADTQEYHLTLRDAVQEPLPQSTHNGLETFPDFFIFYFIFLLQFSYMHFGKKEKIHILFLQRITCLILPFEKSVSLNMCTNLWRVEAQTIFWSKYRRIFVISYDIFFSPGSKKDKWNLHCLTDYQLHILYCLISFFPFFFHLTAASFVFIIQRPASQRMLLGFSCSRVCLLVKPISSVDKSRDSQKIALSDCITAMEIPLRSSPRRG